MRVRFIRPFFQQKSILFGVRLGDWKYIGAVGIALFAGCVFFRLHIRGFQLAMPTAALSIVAGMAFFNWVRIKRRPLWLEHKLSANWRSLIGKGHNLISVNTGTPRYFKWLKNAAETAAPDDISFR